MVIKITLTQKARKIWKKKKEDKGKTIDESKTTKETYPQRGKLTKAEFDAWKKKPNRRDIKGVDTASQSRIKKQIANKDDVPIMKWKITFPKKTNDTNL